MANLHIFYRLSDDGRTKQRLDYIGNRLCLENFLREFPVEQTTLIADNVSDSTWNWLQAYSFKSLVQTRLGNSGSFWRAFELALKLPPHDEVYFVENDYVHRPGSMIALKEGLRLADYVTLYDHPDKYVEGVNPKVKRGGEVSRVLLSGSTHWKHTNSTTMTFASKVGILRSDRLFFKHYTVGWTTSRKRWLRRFGPKRFPKDYRLFSALSFWKGRRLISPLPGFSTHGEALWLAPLIDWRPHTLGIPTDTSS